MENQYDNNELFKPVGTEMPNYIKVIGVGGGGGNAVNHMMEEGIQGVDFILCNTDYQALMKSNVKTKLHLGQRDLGAGNDPAKGREAAEMSKDDIEKLLDDSTKMLFVTAGMGGGTGTGATPVIAKIAKDEIDTLYAFLHHVVDGIAAATAHTDDFNVVRLFHTDGLE